MTDWHGTYHLYAPLAHSFLLPHRSNYLFRSLVSFVGILIPSHVCGEHDGGGTNGTVAINYHESIFNSWKMAF